jgi:tRNA threonylcarbamoyladenosine biosynthesis protein TsaE
MGELGSGKTVFTKGLASGIGVQEWSRVTSPTFVLRQDYQGKLRIHHYDVNRLSGPREFLDLGFADDLDSGAVVVVEWADRVLPAMPAGSLLVEFEHWGLPEPVSGTSSGDPGLRRITFRGGSVFWEETIRAAMI